MKPCPSVPSVVFRHQVSNNQNEAIREGLPMAWQVKSGATEFEGTNAKIKQCFCYLTGALHLPVVPADRGGVSLCEAGFQLHALGWAPGRFN
jgi:hypothetical protein